MSTLEILKNAILLEKRGKAFYLKVAEQAEHSQVKHFFEMMAEEENNHIKMLSSQFKEYQANKQFAPNSFDDKSSSNAASEVLTRELKEKISSAGFEAAAISAAMAMEEQAIKLYRERSETAEDPEEKSLYKWLAAWEIDHLNSLVKIDNSLKEKIWNDNNFWPF